MTLYDRARQLSNDDAYLILLTLANRADNGHTIDAEYLADEIAERETIR